MSNLASFKTLLWTGEPATVRVKTHTLRLTLSLSPGKNQIVHSSVIFRDDVYCRIINLQWCLRSGLRFFHILPKIWLRLHSDLWSVSKNHCWDAIVSKTLTLAALTLLPLLENAYHSDHVWPTLSCCPTVFTKTAVRAVGFWDDHVVSYKFPITFKRYWSWAVGASKAMPLSEPCPRTSQLARVPSGSWRLWERMNNGNVMNHWVPVALCSQPKLANASSVRYQIAANLCWWRPVKPLQYISYSQHCYHDGPDAPWQKRNREWVSVLVSQSHLQRVDTTCNVCQRNASQFN